MEKLICKRCKHEWVRRQEKLPVKCPKCTSPYWDKDYAEKSQNKTKSK